MQRQDMYHTLKEGLGRCGRREIVLSYTLRKPRLKSVQNYTESDISWGDRTTVQGAKLHSAMFEIVCRISR
jgi:hypothetical protein